MAQHVGRGGAVGGTGEAAADALKRPDLPRAVACEARDIGEAQQQGAIDPVAQVVEAFLFGRGKGFPVQAPGREGNPVVRRG